MCTELDLSVGLNKRKTSVLEVFAEVCKAGSEHFGRYAEQGHKLLLRHGFAMSEEDRLERLRKGQGHGYTQNTVCKPARKPRLVPGHCHPRVRYLYILKVSLLVDLDRPPLHKLKEGEEGYDDLYLFLCIPCKFRERVERALSFSFSGFAGGGKEKIEGIVS